MITVGFYFREFDKDSELRRGPLHSGDFKWNAREFVNPDCISQPNVIYAPQITHKFELPGSGEAPPLKNGCQDSVSLCRGIFNIRTIRNVFV